MGAALLGLIAPARSGGGKELLQIAVAKGVAQHAEGACRIAEAARHLG
jgi:hypothetical protein